MSDTVAISAIRRQVRELVDGTLEVKLHVEPRFKQDFHRLFPEIDVPVALAPLNLNTPTRTADSSHASEEGIKDPGDGEGESRTNGNELARKLHVDGWFRNPKLWERMEEAGLYTQKEHKTYIESQPCLGTKVAGHIVCEGDVVAHHVKTAANSGVGIKPDNWFCVPMCHAHHMGWAHASLGASRQDKSGLLECAVQLTADKMKVAMKEHLGIASLRDLTPELLKQFEERIGL